MTFTCVFLASISRSSKWFPDTKTDVDFVDYIREEMDKGEWRREVKHNK